MKNGGALAVTSPSDWIGHAHAIGEGREGECLLDGVHHACAARVDVGGEVLDEVVGVPGKESRTILEAKQAERKLRGSHLEAVRFEVLDDGAPRRGAVAENDVWQPLHVFGRV